MKRKSLYTCTECGASNPKWQGQCPGCGQWNTLVETVAETAGAGGNRYAGVVGSGALQALAAIRPREEPRQPTGIEEFDRVLGGGLVEGAVVLIGGDPGIGKSTLLLQALDALQRAGRSTLYVTGACGIRPRDFPESHSMISRVSPGFIGVFWAGAEIALGLFGLVAFHVSQQVAGLAIQVRADGTECAQADAHQFVIIGDVACG